MKGCLTIIPVTGAVSSKELTAPPSLEALQGGVGGFIEHVPMWTRFEGQPCAAFCNERGKLEGMEVNVLATVLWQQQQRIRIDDALVGPIVIVTGDKELMEEL